MHMTEWNNRDERQRDARAEYEHIMTTPSPDPMNAFIDSGVIGFVFGEMWRRGVLTPRDRRWITLSCVGAMDALIPIQPHVWAALNSGDVTDEEFDEFVLFFGTQMGWPKASALSAEGMVAMIKLAEARGEQPRPLDFEPWVGPDADDVRRRRGEAAYREVHGVDAPTSSTAFRGRAYLDFLYGEIWTRMRHLTRRDRRVISISCSAAAGVDDETREQLRAAITSGDLGFEELQELVVHVGVYVGWLLARRLDDLLVEVADQTGAAG
jgi:4-carboxymuconolactone decarboxylase